MTLLLVRVALPFALVLAFHWIVSVTGDVVPSTGPMQLVVTKVVFIPRSHDLHGPFKEQMFNGLYEIVEKAKGNRRVMNPNQQSQPLVEVGQDVYRMSGGVANFYLIEQSGRMTLVDAGTPADWQPLQRALATCGMGLHCLEAVVLTHAHADHTGFAEQARTETGATVWVDQEDADVARGSDPGKNDGGMLRYLWRPEFYRTLISLTRRGGAKIVPVVEVSTFKDGERLDVPGTPIVVHTPGHTPGNAALLLDDRRVLLCGDTIVTRNPLTGRRGPQIMPSGFNRNTAEAIRSLSALAGLKADVLLPGHGDPWTGGVAEAVRLARIAGPS